MAFIAQKSAKAHPAVRNKVLIAFSLKKVRETFA
jgi:hypothetical protein